MPPLANLATLPLRFAAVTESFTPDKRRFKGPSRHFRAIIRGGRKYHLSRDSLHGVNSSLPAVIRRELFPCHLFPFPLFTLLVHRCVPIAYTGVNRRDRHLCIRTRQISVDLPRRTIPTFAAAGKDHLLPQENFFWCRRKIRRVAASEPSPGAKRPSLNPQPIRG